MEVCTVEKKIGFVGGGAMAQAIAEGLVTSGTVDPANISASATSNRFKDWWTSRGMGFCTFNNTIISNAEVVFIAVKPHLYTGMLETLRKEGHKYPEKLWVSIMAGVVMKDLTKNLAMVTNFVERVVRTIPNTPSKVRKGSVAVTFSDNCTEVDRSVVTTMFSSVGRCLEIPESLQNAFAAMCGSGPAFVYQVIEALADGGVMMGLPRNMAMEQAAAMVEGAAGMVLLDPSTLQLSRMRSAVQEDQPSEECRDWRRVESGLLSWQQFRLQLNETKNWAKTKRS